MLNVRLGSRSVLDEFEQHAASRGGVDKSDEAPAGAVARLLIYQTCASGFEARECRPDVWDADGDVMYAGPALLQKLGDGRVRAGRLKQLDARLAGGQHRHVDALLLDRLGVPDLQPQRVAPEPERLLDAARGDAD